MAEGETPVRFSEDLTIDELREILPPMCELPFAETNRLNMVRGHVLNLLDEAAPAHTASIDKAYLRHLGAEAVLAYLPEK
jgi:hypothetical protein